VYEQHVTVKIFTAACSLSDADSHLFPELEKFVFVQFALYLYHSTRIYRKEY